jgi:hypothetical protein
LILPGPYRLRAKTRSAYYPARVLADPDTERELDNGGRYWLCRVATAYLMRVTTTTKTMPASPYTSHSAMRVIRACRRVASVRRSA